MGKKSALVVAAVLTIVSGTWHASPQPQESNPSTSVPIQQTETDEACTLRRKQFVTRVLKIYYEVTATTAGAKRFYKSDSQGQHSE